VIGKALTSGMSHPQAAIKITAEVNLYKGRDKRRLEVNLIGSLIHNQYYSERNLRAKLVLIPE
jgi:hypothetical protein